MNGARVRRDIWTLEAEQPWHPITRAYALGIAGLQSQDPAASTSWAYQAAIHGVPGFGQPDRFRGQCQHNTWFFLPWHRLYLHWFERLVQAAVSVHPDIPQETKDGWALPYWNYGAGGQRASLPTAFRQETLPEDSSRKNPLFVANRNSFVNQGEPLDDRATTADDALREPTFSEARPAGGFGGAATGWNHLDQDPKGMPGMLEQTPHGAVHMEVGGLMARFDTAGLDPVFWMHHANIDRLWEVWLGQDGRVNPDPTSSWGTTLFHFHDEAGEAVSGTAADVLDTATDLGYTYEDVSVPEPRRRRRRRRVEEPPDHPAELVGATADPIELTGGRTKVGFAIDRPSGPAARRGPGETPERAYLAIEGIEGEGDPGVTYAVYLNLPDDDDPNDDPESHYAGNVSFFGIEGVGNVDNDPAGHSLRYSFDITELVEELSEQNMWDPEEVAVTFTPLRRGRGDRGDREGTGPPVKVGRVGVYFQ
jgi:tyrosinase